MRSFLKSSVLGAIDQALMSAFSLLIALGIIHWAPKDEYAIYTILLTAVVLAQTLQNALINSPLITLYNTHTETIERNAIFASAFGAQCFLIIVVALCGLSYLLVSFIGGYSGFSTNAIVAATFASLGVIAREYARGMHYLRNNALGALISDVIYIFISMAIIGLYAKYQGVTATGILASLGIAGFISGLTSTYRLGVHIGLVFDITQQGLKEIWACARWTLPSVIVSWAYANAYILIVQYYLGLAEVAELSAARLFLMPLSLLSVGWSSVFRPKSSKLFTEGKYETINAIMRISVGGFAGLTAAYGILLMIALPFLQKYVLGSKYIGIDYLVFYWFLYFSIAPIRVIGTAAMMASKTSFKPLFYYSVVAAAATTAGVVIAAFAGQPDSVIVVLTLGEIGLAAYVWHIGWPRCVIVAKTNNA